MKRFSTLMVMLALVAVRGAAGDGTNPKGIGLAEEEIFELRMERLLNTSGPKVLVARLQREVAENRGPWATAWLANFQLYGDLLGVPEIHDEKTGIVLARKAMHEGSVFGRELVGRALVDGRGTPRMPAPGAILLEKAAEAGRYTAMNQLAALHYYGTGVVKDLARAEMLARRAAYRGAPHTLAYMGEWMEAGRAGRAPDIGRACGYYLEAAEWGSGEARQRLEVLAKEGNAEARVSLSLLLLFDLATGGDFTSVRIKRAVQMLETERPDDPRALVAVGQTRLERQLPVFDADKAWAALEKAAQRGDADGRYFQAEMLRRGIGRKKDAVTAVAQIQALAEQGNAHAMGRLGWLHYWGAGEVPKDEGKAFALTRDAAHAGDMFSILSLGFMHEHGVGTREDYYMSARYYSIAEDVGFIEARRRKNSALAKIK